MFLTLLCLVSQQYAASYRLVEFKVRSQCWFPDYRKGSRRGGHPGLYVFVSEREVVDFTKRGACQHLIQLDESGRTVMKDNFVTWKDNPGERERRRLCERLASSSFDCGILTIFGVSHGASMEGGAADKVSKALGMRLNLARERSKHCSHVLVCRNGLAVAELGTNIPSYDAEIKARFILPNSSISDPARSYKKVYRLSTFAVAECLCELESKDDEVVLLPPLGQE